MKNKYKLLGLLGLLPFFATAQLTNNGASIIIEEGATLVVEGDIDNMASSTITNSGTIEVKGNFVNDGTLTSVATNSDIIFSGDAAQSFDANGATVRKVTVTNTDADVSLTATGLGITNELVFETGSANLDIAGQDLTLGAGAIVTRGASDGYIKADGAGQVVKTYDALESFVFPIGDANGYTPLEAEVTAGTVGTSTISVNLKDAIHPALPQDASNPNRNATEYLTKYWDVDQSGFGGSFSADITGTYDDTNDKVLGGGAESLIKAALYDGVNWTYEDVDNTGSDQVAATITDSRELTGSNTFGKSMVSVILGGAYDDASNLMRTDLNGGSGGILATQALTSPYGTGETVTAGFFDTHATVVDWVLVELRDVSDDETVIASRSAFVLNDGSLMDFSGTDNDVLYFKNASASTYVSIKHRNHLGIMLNNTTPLLSTIGDIDFTALAANTFGTHAQQSFDAKMMMWGGDVDGNGIIYSNNSPSDANSVTSIVLSHPGNTGFFGSGPIDSYLGVSNVYSPGDINFDGSVLANASPSDSSIPANSVLSHPGNTGFFGSGPVDSYLLLIEQLPEN
ncbi:hypothetical protein [Portibacter lacus]|uniref:T9SS C-terminal target domain-containing protein n=1 Tax=Portibacter lacus TaxID=1099794 RepID=A0AA37SK67_9BACT|nr:hypothetical protein [Portibacter lacus]GLR15535.1 hypothetical protein GCM10007940_01500 [Portibacter lacus]